MSAFGGFVLRRLAEKGLSQAEAARRSPFSRQSLTNWINGNVRRIELENIVALAVVLDVAPYFLLQLLAREIGIVLETPTPALESRDVSRFVDDVSIPDNSIVHVGERFEKRWAVQNVGRQAWSDRRLICTDERPAGGHDRPAAGGLEPIAREVPVPPAAPGDVVEIAVELVAPEQPGTVRSNWEIVDAAGMRCFPESPGLWCQVKVVTF